MPGRASRGRASRCRISTVAPLAPWRPAAIEPLRAARRGLNPAERDGVAALYEAAKAIELAAERMGQEQPPARAPPLSPRAPPRRAADAAANLTLYLDAAAVRQAAAPLFAALAQG